MGRWERGGGRVGLWRVSGEEVSEGVDRKKGWLVDGGEEGE